MHKLSMFRIACACVSAAAAMSARLRRTHPYTSSNSRSPASGGHTGNDYYYLIGACAPVAGPALLCKTAALQCRWMSFKCHAHGCPQASGGIVLASKWGPKWGQNGSPMAIRRPLGASWPPEGLLERSWRLLGVVWEASRALLELSWRPLGCSWACLVRL